MKLLKYVKTLKKMESEDMENPEMMHLSLNRFMLKSHAATIGSSAE
jgi:hypothetical protein